MSKLLATASLVASLGMGYLYLQACYAAWLECPDKINMSLIPKCMEAQDADNQ